MSKHQSAELILKLYDLRREPVMREARNWMAGFFPESADDIMRVMIDPKTSAYYRMVLSYWDMAASLVNHDAIEAEMFNDASGEHVVFFSKIHPFLEDVRAMMENPGYLRHLETLIMKMPEPEQTMAGYRERMKRWMAARDEMAKGATS